MQIRPGDCQKLLPRPSGLVWALWEPSQPPGVANNEPWVRKGNAKQAETQKLLWLPAAETWWMALPMELMCCLPGLYHCFFLPKDDGIERVSFQMSSDKKLGQALRVFAKQWDIFLSRAQPACCQRRRGKLLKGINNMSNTTKPRKPSVFRKTSCSYLPHPAVTVSRVWSHLARLHSGWWEQSFSAEKSSFHLPNPRVSNPREEQFPSSFFLLLPLFL